MASACLTVPSRFFFVILAVAGLLLTSCTDASEVDNAPAAETIIERAIAAQSGDLLDRAVVEFDFRGEHFRIRHEDGRFSYARTYEDSLGREVREVLTNDSLYREIDGQRVDLSEEERPVVEEDVNSVTYFALLPYFLQDPAVRASYAGPDTIEGTPYHRIAVSFRKEGGGPDWQDRFLYWFRQDDYAMDYFAYAYGLGPGEEPDTRFREAFNVRHVGGVRFADHYNYTVDTLSPSNLARYGDFVGSDSLELVSTIAHDSIRVRPL